ncbi:efflux RND transporter periplasmic adaptor subunit [Aliikangiella marina]|uniref:Efflux RND transporter periplasmic adaptor subunit n=1 Tax=Aliikangiella marina TaxID=1712262 RepID=A0A545TCJ7_9GAMM|nr:efflux RND transporter periplasmic adaptor subunit [Aliikangiella marina]TQV74906.1 efflux RND transporter periplasmic adaptor subunit [Aliikangiella marina]
MSRGKSVAIGFGIFFAGIAVIVLLMAARPKPPKKPVENSSPLVEVVLPSAQSVTFEVKAHGVVKPRTETVLVSEVAGVVDSLSDKFVAGGYFQKGEVLLQIDPTDYEVGVEQAKARLASQKAQYAQEKAKAEQARKEWDLTGRSRENAPILALREPFLLEAKANMQSAEADLKKAQQKLARTTIRAPYDGMVKMKQVDVGQFVATGTQLGTTFAIDYAEVRLPLTDQELAFINVPEWGTEAQTASSNVTLVADYAGQETRWQAKLVRMEGVVDDQSRVHYAVARISDPYSVLESTANPAPLKIGTFVTAVISGKQEDNLIKLPREVFKDLTQVLVSDKENKLYTRELEVIRSEADAVYVRSGLNDGDRVLMTSIESPVQGMSLRVAGDPEPEPAEELEQTEEEYAQQP